MTSRFLFALLLSVIAVVTTAEARSRYVAPDAMRIESRFDPNKYIIVPVRRAHDGGREVRLPGGTWLHCARNCEWTVQKRYLDFFAYQQNPFGPGYLRFEIWR